jgi:uncharacterized protein YcbX
VALHWADLGLIVAIVIAGCGAVYFLVLGRLRRMLAENQRETERRLAALTEAMTMRSTVSTETVPGTDGLTATEIESEAGAGLADFVEARAEVREAPQSADATELEYEQIPPEIKVAIAAIAIATLGNHASVRSARRVPSSDVVSPWTQQGRVIVQSSHNLRTRG